MERSALMSRVLTVLRDGGAMGDAYLEERNTLRLVVRQGRIEDLQRAQVRGMAVRAMKDGRLGFVHTSDCTEDGVAGAATRALELAGFGSQRDDLLLPDPVGPGDGSDEGAALAIYDLEIEKRTIHEKEEWARSAEAVARGVDPRIKKTDGARYEENLSSFWLANTNGLSRHYRKSTLEAAIEVIAEDQGDKQPGTRATVVSRWSDLPDPSVFGREAGEMALRLLGGRPVATGSFPVIFSPDAGWTLLVYLATALQGDHLSRERSWLNGKLDSMLASPLVTVRDDPRRMRGAASRPFDAEGVDTQTVPLLDQGKVGAPLFDLASAKRMSKSSTGSALRDGYETLPHIATSNLYMAAGATKPEEILASVDKGLWVWGLAGWWIGLEPSNPQFSSAASGLWIEKGKPVKPVARITVAGSLAEILAGIDAVGDDLTFTHVTRTPTFRAKSMAVAGA
jgi:PmbA protein